MRVARTTRATTPSAAPISSAWCAIDCRRAIAAPMSAPGHSAGRPHRARPPARPLVRSRRRKQNCRPCEGQGGGRPVNGTPLGGRTGRTECADLGEKLAQLTAVVHLERDVATADQLAVDVELGISGPVGETLERFTQLRLLEDVDVLELRAD